MTLSLFQDVNNQVIFFTENLQVSKKVFLPLYLLVAVSGNVDRYLNLSIENAARDPNGALQQVYLFGSLSILSSVVFPVLLMTVALFAFNNPKNEAIDLGGFLKKYLNQICIETLRAWGKTLLWTLLFILPGIWKYIEYSLVPLVVTSSKVYDEGNEDALRKSAQVVRHRWLPILGILFVFHLFVPIILSVLFDAYRLIWKTPIASLSLSVLDTYLILISTHLLFKIFQSEADSYDESHV